VVDLQISSNRPLFQFLVSLILNYSEFIKTASDAVKRQGWRWILWLKRWRTTSEKQSVFSSSA